MDYLFKKFPKFPFSMRIALTAIVWTIPCALFGILLILTKADFETTGTKTIFVFSSMFYVGVATIFALFEYGALRLLGIKKERKRLRIINDNITGRHLLPNLSSETLIKVFNALSKAPIDPVIAGSRYISIVVVLILLTEWIVSEKIINIPTILIGGFISLILYVLFVAFFMEKSIFPTLKECRELLLKRGEKIKEPKFRFSNLKTKFTLFLLIPVITVLIILNFISALNINILAFAFLGLVMSIMISRLLASSIYEAFLGIKNFAKELPTKEKTLFSTGSLDTEIIDLSENLNKAADEVYTARRELEEAKATLEAKIEERTRELEILAKSLEVKVKQKTKEFQERVDELEKFHRLTIGRELKMVELKKKIEELEEKLYGKAAE
ncbi:MAG: hypothetical protein ABIE43_00075 [Patescibacteria group bacterium]